MAIEPMLVLPPFVSSSPLVSPGSRPPAEHWVPGTRLLDDGWTVVTQDGSIAAHFEHTVAITPDGPWVLTAEDGGLSGLASVAATASDVPGHEAPVGARRV